MKVEQKLREMGLELPELPKPNGLYAPSRRVGNLIYIAGQTPDIHGVRQVVGVVGEDLTIEDGQRSAQICALNILSVLKAELGDLDKVKQFVQIISYVRCAKGFGNQPLVIDGASRLFRDLYGEAGIAARLAIGANELPGQRHRNTGCGGSRGGLTPDRGLQRTMNWLLYTKNQAAPWYIFYKI
ncbi:MAG: RidA family protein [Enterocloster bolteae]